jgi:hypothetical protein
MNTGGVGVAEEVEEMCGSHSGLSASVLFRGNDEIVQFASD